MTSINDKDLPLLSSEAEIWDAIAAFEKILEALPNDRLSLETLADAYEKIGDHTRAQDYLLRLSTVILNERDEEAAPELAKKLQNFAPNHPAAQTAVTRLQNLKPEKVRAEVLEIDPSSLRKPNISAEITFAWNLMQTQKISQEEYSDIIHDLTESSANTALITTSTLHVLHEKRHPQLYDILSFTSLNTRVPLISLIHFEIQPECVNILPLEFSIRRGAVVFELMDDDILTAILNPYDEQLALDIEAITGKQAHFYLVEPLEFDSAIEKTKSMLESESPTPAPELQA